ncbi:microfibril-associated glycoprotein 4-like isoform X2 [Hyperolius riggenbachi]|uniref:microfibril-associated glycoprotein 4-like isoform X2 n=1 Tax=Hyperolius riggenbachi TaxID=752182 RepID=UPI0035A3CDDE
MGCVLCAVQTTAVLPLPELLVINRSSCSLFSMPEVSGCQIRAFSHPHILRKDHSVAVDNKTRWKMRIPLITVFLAIWGGCWPSNVPPLNMVNMNICSDVCIPHDCSDVWAQGLKTDGVYLIYPGGKLSTPIPVYCDMTGKDGPWTVFQKRFDGRVNFYRGWEEYKVGFGRADGEHWLGLENIHLLTLKKFYRLWIGLKEWDGVARYVTYKNFSLSRLAINPEEDGYKLHVEGFQEGDPNRPTGDSLSDHIGMNFSTYDKDRDIDPRNCAETFHGAWWYSKCHASNLNGKYLNGTTTEYATGMVWSLAKGHYYSFTETVMKIAPFVQTN